MSADTTHTREPEALPRLAVLFESSTVQMFQFVEAAEHTWKTVWLIDRTLEDLGALPRLLARFGEVVDITGLDPVGIKDALHAQPVDGIITFGEDLLVRAASIAAELGLPFYSPETAHALTNKAAQRRAFRAAGIPTPGSALVPAGTAADACRELVADLVFPVVVKPISGNSSQDTLPFDDAEELIAHLSAADPAHPHRDMVVEERIPDGWPTGERPYADYVSVESFVSNGRASHFGVTGRTPLAEPFRETGSFQPSTLSDEEYQAATRAAGEAIAALGAEVGAFHTEIKLTPAGCRILEVNGRLGGGGIPRIAAAVSGQSLYNAAGRIALGQEVDATGAEFSRVGFYYALQPPIGARTLLSLEGLDDLRRLPGIIEVIVGRRPGDHLDPLGEGSRGYVCAVYGIVETHEDLWTMLQTLHDTVEVTYGE